MRFSIQSKSEAYILNRLTEHIAEMNRIVKALYEQQLSKSELNSRVVTGIKRKGPRFTGKLEEHKRLIIEIISKQEKEIEIILKNTEKIQHLLGFLINMEQASLALHVHKDKDDLSRMVDVYGTPVEKFKNEVEQVGMLHSSFEIMKVELEKQKEYIRKFDIDPATLDEDFFAQSEEYESSLSQEEIISVEHLREFCNDLSRMIDTRLSSKRSFIADADQYAREIMHDLKHTKVKRGFFLSLSVYDFIRKLVTKNIRSDHLSKLLVLVIAFLLSRLKKLDRASFNSQLRITILLFNLLKYVDMPDNQRYAITGAALIDHLGKLGLKPRKSATQEHEVVQNYYRAAHKLFNDELTFVTSIIDATDRVEDTNLPWVHTGAHLIGLVKDFDTALVKADFDPAKLNAENLKSTLSSKYKIENIDKYCTYLLQGWKSLIPADIR
jgi:hypothetical protein